KMRGHPLSRRSSADGRWAYTLYDGAGATPFVHVLDTVGRTGHCIDLGGIASGTDLWQLRLRIDRDGKQLVVRNSANPVSLIDLRTLSVTRATAADAEAGETRHLPLLLLLTAGGFVLVALAVGVIWARRRQRHTLPSSIS